MATCTGRFINLNACLENFWSAGINKLELSDRSDTFLCRFEAKRFRARTNLFAGRNEFNQQHNNDDWQDKRQNDRNDQLLWRLDNRFVFFVWLRIAHDQILRVFGWRLE